MSRSSKPVNVTAESIFDHLITAKVNTTQAVHINEDESSSLQVPTPPFESTTIEQALKEDAVLWRLAIKAELKSLYETNTYTILSGHPPPGKKVVSSRMILRRKFRGTLTRARARFVIRGFEKQYDTDYFETFNSIIRYNTLRILLSKAAAEDLDIEAFEVDTAFLNPVLKEEIYMEVPDFFSLQHPGVTSKTSYLKLNKYLYGLENPSSYLRHKVIQEHFKRIGMTYIYSDDKLFVGRGVYVLLYDEDMLIIGPAKSVQAVKVDLMRTLKCQSLGPVELFAGIQVQRNREQRSLRIHQSLYTTKLLRLLEIDNYTTKNLPLPAKTFLRSSVDEDPWDLLKEDEVALYRQIVGSVIFLANGTRPDISYSAGRLARFMVKPNTNHLSTAKHLVEYLNGTRDFGITYSSKTKENSNWAAWADAMWGVEDKNVFEGYVTTWHGGAVTWSSCRKKSPAENSLDATIVAAREGARELAWMENLATETTMSLISPPLLHVDSYTAIIITSTARPERPKRVEISYFYLREDMVKRNRLKLATTPKSKQMAVILTKQPPRDQFVKLVSRFGLSN